MSKSITQLQQEEQLLLATIKMLDQNLKNTQREIAVLQGNSRIPWKRMIMAEFTDPKQTFTTSELLERFITKGLAKPVSRKHRKAYIVGISVSIACLCKENVLSSHDRKGINGFIYQLNTTKK